MRKIASVAAMAAALAFAGTAYADDANQGHWQVKVLGTGVLAQGSLAAATLKDPYDFVSTNLPHLGGSANTAASNNYVPTVAVEYFFTPNVSVETICCMTGHHVNGTGSYAGVAVVDNINIIPATFTAKYHFTGLPMGVKPYVGVGPTMFIMVTDRPSTTLTGMGVTRTKLSSEFGAAFQAGVDIPLTGPYTLSLDAKKYLVNTNAHFYSAAHGDTADVRVHLNPWVVSAGVGYRF